MYAPDQEQPVAQRHQRNAGQDHGLQAMAGKAHCGQRPFCTPASFQKTKRQCGTVPGGDAICEAQDDLPGREGRVCEGHHPAEEHRLPRGCHLIWKYKTTVSNPEIAGTVLKVIAYDKPGNEGEGEMRL